MIQYSLPRGVLLLTVHCSWVSLQELFHFLVKGVDYTHGGSGLNNNYLQGTC